MQERFQAQMLPVAKAFCGILGRSHFLKEEEEISLDTPLVSAPSTAPEFNIPEPIEEEFVEVEVEAETAPSFEEACKACDNGLRKSIAHAMPKRALDETGSRLYVWATSGKQVASFPVEELTDVQTLKVRLEKSCGLPRFRQRLLSQQRILADHESLDLPLHVHLVLLPFCSASWEQRRCFVLAARSGSATVVEQLLQRPQDPNLMDCFGEVALREAARANDMAIAALLLEAKSDPDIRGEGYTALAIAAYAGSSDILKLLLAATANPDVTREDGTALHQALGNYNDKKWERYETTVTLLLEFRASVDIVDKRGRTALHAASCIPGPGRARMVKQLVMAKANVNAADKEQLTALHCSSRHGCLDSARCLLQARADIGLKDCRSRTALHAACSSFDCVPYTVAVDLLRLLLQARADKDAVDDVHGTALHYALQSKDGTMLLLRCLLDAGARMEVADKHGCTALQCALQQSHQPSGVRILFQSLPRKAQKDVRVQIGIVQDLGYGYRLKNWGNDIESGLVAGSNLQLRLTRLFMDAEVLPEVDVVRQSTAMTGFSSEDEERFWSVLSAFDAAQRSAFAVFVSACS
ncbi:Ank2, partial [Symbiodinium sp. KB8]